MNTQRKASVLIADAEPVARYGLARLVDSHEALSVCGETETLGAARDLCAKHHPNVMVMDPLSAGGFAFIKDLRRWSAGTRVVAWSALTDALSVQRALQAGVCGYVTRRDPVDVVIAAIVGAVTGERHVGPHLAHVLLERMACGVVEMKGEETADLSNRELEVFRLIGRGFGTRAVADELHLSIKTVETHRQRIREKMHLANGSDLQRRAMLAQHAAEGAVSLPSRSSF